MQSIVNSITQKNNKNKNGNLQVIKLSNYFENPYINEISKVRDWLMYDVDDLFPQRLLDLNNSTFHQAILQKKIDYCIGKGLKFDTNDIALKEFLDTCTINTTLDELIRRCFNDLIIFDGFSLNLIADENSEKIRAMQHIPFQNVRVGFPDDFNFVNTYYTSNNWQYKYVKNKFAVKASQAFKYQKFEGNSILYSYFYNSVLKYYPKPSYFSACNYIALEDELSRFYLNFVENNMVPSFSIIFPHNATEEQKSENAKNIQQFYAGGSNAGNVLLMYGEPNSNGESQVPTLNTISQANNADLYTTLHNEVKQNIMTAHGLTSPVLAGIPGSGSLGGNANEIAIAYEVYYNTVIKKYQEKFLNELKNILKFNGLSTDIEIINNPPVKTSYSEAFMSEILTTDEKRALVGYESLTADDTTTNTQQEDLVDENFSLDLIYKNRYNEN